jgi:RNA polymerase sigma-70 factor (ECF subfamily)
MSGSHATDADLVARTLEGNLQAFERLVLRHRTRIFGIARQITHDTEAAQDIAQEALVNAFRALPSLRDTERFGQWLNTIVRRQGQRWLRDGRHRPELMGEAVLFGAPSAIWTVTPDPPGQVVALVRDALAALTQRERQVVILHYLEGHTCEEIAAKLALPAGSVKRLLHNSRHKLRKEARTMAKTERKGPRRLKAWISGSIPPGRWNVFDHLRPLLAQAVCLAVNKEAKTVDEVAAEVDANNEYVRQTLADLAEVTALVPAGRGRYVASFIAFDAADWRRLVSRVPEPAAQVAERFAAAEGRIRDAFGHTPLAANGWHWQDVVWVVYGVMLANTAMCRIEQKETPTPAREWPGGGRFWLGGRAEVPDLPVPWITGLNGSYSWPQLELGNYWTWQIERQETSFVSDGRDRGLLLEALTEGELPEAELVARVPDTGRGRAALADLLQVGFVRVVRERYRLNLPLFTRGDSDILAPVLDAIAAPIMDEIIRPAVAGLESLLDEMGYTHRRDQYAAWRVWLAHDITGEAVHFLMEQGLLPKPSKPAPPNFGHLLWERGIQLMDFGKGI